MGHYFVIGLNHKTAAVQLRERLYFREQEISESLSTIVKMTSLDEVMIVSTCNRVEIIGVCLRLDKVFDILVHFMARIKGLMTDEIKDALYFLTNQDALKHVFRVAASLDSMIIGEPQILGQMKCAQKIADQSGTMGKELRLLLNEAFRVAKKVRTETNIAAHAVSVSFVAVELARKILNDIAEARIMVIGTGKMSTLTVQYLTRHTTSGRLYITNRSREHAESFAAQFQGEVIPFERRKELLGRLDIIISSTASREYVLTADDVRGLERQGRPLFIIDIAVPRDIDPEIKSIPGIHLFNIDDLREVAQMNLKTRLKEAKKAEKIVLTEVKKFEKCRTINTIKPLIISLQNKMKQIRSDELQRHVKELGRMNEQDRQFVEHITTSLINRILHQPLCSLKKELLFEKPLPPLKVIEKIFDLNQEGTACPCPDEEEAGL